MSALTGLRLFEVPMRLRFRRVTSRAGVLLEGPAGWGEFSPFPDYGPAYASRWLAAAREAATVGFPDPVRDRVPVNTTVPAVDPERAHALVAASGCRTAKVKVAETGQDLADDLARVSAVRDALGPGGRVRVDANGAWDVETAVLALTRLDRVAGGLEYAEQPCVTLEELREVRRRVPVPLAADESVRTAEDPLRVAGLDAADVVVVKVQPLGGVHRALEVIDAAGLPAVVSSALETSVGLAAGVALAAALPELPHACGLGTATLLAADVTDRPLVPEDGFLPVRRVAPEPAMLDQAAPGPERMADLLERLQAAAAVLEGRAGDGEA
ncbi:o-succinylbenzoate synthase [Egicoccus halophilus]|uniref:o-succinylbenzoate synthase n=1 Tax=Egicoccus halophilus TaxID=1670830 RepID=A0A8J3A9S1_9ACTN|nr:o-succinylbenzoate synthase [Egicoccus halophilus]GGI05703.1 o-succinylbenzoate synthase [Egicoccus halophilus]